MTRNLIKLTLFFAVIIPFGWAVKAGVAELPERLVTLLAGVPLGMGIMLALGFRHRDDKRGV